MQPSLWVALERSPELYPDAVTLLPGIAAEQVLAAVQDGPGCSVKDSFATLDLGRRGFDQLFEAQWILHEPATPGPKSALIWSGVETREELGEWVQAADLAGTIRSELLLESSVRILAAHGPDGLIAGAVANRTGSVVGISNVFTTAVAIDEVWGGMADAVATAFPTLSLVGYERGEQLQAALACGFTAIGPLRMWVRREAPAQPSSGGRPPGAD